MKVEYYSTNVGNFFRIISGNNHYYSHNTLIGNRIVEINGIDVKNLPLLNGWYHIDFELKEFRMSKPSTTQQVGWKLSNPDITSDKIPLELSMEDLRSVYDLEDDGYIYVGAYSSIASLYEPKVENLPEEVLPIEVEVIKLRDLHVENFNAPSEMKVGLKSGNYGSDKIQTTDLSTIAVFSDIERMLTPEPFLHMRPCSLTSQQVYKIVRAHIINNIDGKVARITSNYDFCFEVQRVVEYKPIEIKQEKLTNSGRSYKPPRFVSSTSNSKLVKLFEMTWMGADKGKGYGAYTVIEGWEANNLQELYENMQKYLSDLMQEINKPMIECQACNGTGCLTKKITTNER